MATTLFGDASLPATSANQANVGGIATGFALPTLTTGFAGQQSLADLLSSIGGTNVAAGTGGVSGIQQLLLSLGIPLSQFGTTLQGAGVQAETTGQLPPAAQPFFMTQLNDMIQGIKGKYASLGMSGSTAEQQEITDAQNRSAASQFQLAEQLGGQMFTQGSDVLKTGIGAVTTGGSLSTTLAELGMQGYQLSLNDITNIASEGLNALGLGGSTFSNLTNQQLTADQEYSSSITNLFSAIGSFLPWGGGRGTAGGTRGGGFLPSSLLPANPITG